MAFACAGLDKPLAFAGGVVGLVMPLPGSMIALSPSFTPSILQGMTINVRDPFQLDFLVRRSDAELNSEEKQREYTKLVKYFLASLTVPDQDQWVNLSPYEHQRIIAGDFSRTEMGRDLLAQDYLLKQISSSLMYPQSHLGKLFWDKVYERAAREFGNTPIPVNTFNKVWIVPDQADIYESGSTVLILKSHLKVMLEEDYLSLHKHMQTDNAAQSAASKIIKAVILPALEKEVNEGRNFALLRQVYSGMILAAWYKKALKESILGKIYADKAKISSLNADRLTLNAQQIYQQYLKAFKKGVYNIIKEDEDRMTHEIIPRKYFAGGFDQAALGRVMRHFDRATIAQAGNLSLPNAGQMDKASVALVNSALPVSNQAMLGAVKNKALSLLLRAFVLGALQLNPVSQARAQASVADEPAIKIHVVTADLGALELTEAQWVDRFRNGSMRDEMDLLRFLPKKVKSPMIRDAIFEALGYRPKGSIKKAASYGVDKTLRMALYEGLRHFKGDSEVNYLLVGSYDAFGKDDPEIASSIVAALVKCGDPKQVKNLFVDALARYPTAGMAAITIPILSGQLFNKDKRITLQYRNTFFALSNNEDPKIQELIVRGFQPLLKIYPKDVIERLLSHDQYTSGMINSNFYLNFFKENPQWYRFIQRSPEARKRIQEIKEHYPGMRNLGTLNGLFFLGDEEVFLDFIEKVFMSALDDPLIFSARRNLEIYLEANRRNGESLGSVLVRELKRRNPNENTAKILNVVERSDRLGIAPFRFSSSTLLAIAKAREDRPQHPMRHAQVVILPSTESDYNSSFDSIDYVDDLIKHGPVYVYQVAGDPEKALSTIAGDLKSRRIFYSHLYFNGHGDQYGIDLSRAPNGGYLGLDDNNFRIIEPLLGQAEQGVRIVVYGCETGKKEAGQLNFLDGLALTMELNGIKGQALGPDGSPTDLQVNFQDQTWVGVEFKDLKRQIGSTVAESIGFGYYMTPAAYARTVVISERKPRRHDPAQLHSAQDPLGGIDMNAANLAMSIKRDGQGVPLPVSKQDLAQLSRIQGLWPRVLKITSAGRLPILVELKAKGEPSQPPGL